MIVVRTQSHTDAHTDTQIYRQTDTDTHTDTQIHRHSHEPTHAHTHSYSHTVKFQVRTIYTHAQFQVCPAVTAVDDHTWHNTHVN